MLRVTSRTEGAHNQLKHLLRQRNPPLSILLDAIRELVDRQETRYQQGLVRDREYADPQVNAHMLLRPLVKQISRHALRLLLVQVKKSESANFNSEQGCTHTHYNQLGLWCSHKIKKENRPLTLMDIDAHWILWPETVWYSFLVFSLCHYSASNYFQPYSEGQMRLYQEQDPERIRHYQRKKKRGPQTIVEQLRRAADPNADHFAASGRVLSHDEDSSKGGKKRAGNALQSAPKRVTNATLWKELQQLKATQNQATAAVRVQTMTPVMGAPRSNLTSCSFHSSLPFPSPVQNALLRSQQPGMLFPCPCAYIFTVLIIFRLA